MLLPLTGTVCVRTGVPEQVASVGLNRLKVIVPPAVDVAPLMVAASLGMRFGAVVIFGVLGLMMSFSLVQSLVAPLLLPSPLYTACQKNVPALLKVTPLEPGTTPPLTFTVPPSATKLVQAASLKTV